MLSCEHHDYIEIACLYHFEVEIVLHNKDSIQGFAETTETSPDKREWLVIRTDNLNQKINLNDITAMRAITLNSHFDKIYF